MVTTTKNTKKKQNKPKSNEKKWAGRLNVSNKSNKLAETKERRLYTDNENIVRIATKFYKELRQVG